MFVRLTGCPLRCGYCDTTYAFQGGEWFSRDEILEAIAGYDCPRITVTGGEPLAQKACAGLLTRLCDEGYSVSLETSGARDVSGVDPRVIKVMDLKTPGSGECDRNLYANIDYLHEQDQVKFVICDRADYEWAKARIDEYRLAERCSVLFSPSHGQQDPAELAGWVLEDRLPVRFQLQLHKVLWGNAPGR